MVSPFVYLNTVKYLKLRQVACRIFPRFPWRAACRKIPLRPRSGKWVGSIAYVPAPLSRPSRLRDYTLHYHRNPAPGLVSRWIADNQWARGPGWEPYPLSLRIVNWIKWILGGHEPDAALVKSLAAQADFLSRHIEWDLLGNHLFMNATALAFAGAFFLHDGWLRKGLAILEQEITGQVLADGGHCERSPMYHSLVLEALLDLLNLRAVYPGLLPDWSEVAGSMLAWVRAMTHPDGRIAFFNDTAWDVAPPPSLLFEYASRLSVPVGEGVLGESGYFRLENRNSVVLFDAAPLGPDYQPGHAHADTLSFELSHRGRRILVNSGISDYEKGSQRSAERGTAAHNTVRIDGRDSSEVWAAFRVARRAYPRDVQLCGKHIVEAAHNGYTRLRPPVVHRRRLELFPNRLRVLDSLEGTGPHQVEVYFHFYPGALISLHLDPKLQCSQEQTSFHPGFDLSLPNQTIVGCCHLACPASFETNIFLD